jgi:hypothetical protein
MWYAVENKRVFRPRIGVPDPNTGFTNGLNDS